MLELLKKKTTRIALGAGIVLLGGTMPVIPQDMTLLYSIESESSVVLSQVNLGSTTTPIFATKYVSTFDGVKTFGSYFADRSGNVVFVPISEKQYRDMGKVGGETSNPTQTELVSFLDTITDPIVVEAAVAINSSTSGNDESGSATSLTYSHSSGGNPVLVTVSSGGAYTTGVTYNGTSMGQIVTTTNGWAYSKAFFATTTPTGSKNVVVTQSGSTFRLSSGASSLTGTASCVGNDGADFSNTGPWSSSSIDITSATGDLVIDALMSQYPGSTPVIGSGQSSIYSYGGSTRPRVSSYESGATTVTMSWSSPDWEDSGYTHVAVNVPASSDRCQGAGGGGGSSAPEDVIILLE